MGTRSLTVIKDDRKEICCIYRQMDGYIEGGMGEDLAKFLAEMRIVNGYGMDDKAGTAANGMGCLAAQLVAHLKKDIGGIYIYPSRSRDVGEEFVYTLSLGKELQGRYNAINIKVEDHGEVVFDGPAKELLAYIAKEKAAEATS